MAKKGNAKVHRVMHEFKVGALHSGTGRVGRKGPLVKSRAQAIAIALSEAGLSRYGGNKSTRKGRRRKVLKAGRRRRRR
jgi:hypothetical protein